LASSSASKSITICSSAFTSVAVACPVSRSTSVSAMILIAAPRIAGGLQSIGVLAQRLQAGDALLGRQKA
jgi:hypothetical protein